MIHINFPNNEEPPKEWREKADALTDRLKKAKDKVERDRIIDENSHVWGELKEWLQSFSNKKCWFSEATGDSFHWHVEHFRPKKNAKDPNRGGYWWLAFKYLNYRLCGSVTNSKKGCYFPLKTGTTPATCPQDNCDDEAFLLIDPTRKSDVDLITFKMGGIPSPAISDSNCWDYERAEKSIKRYKLDKHPNLCRGRAGVWNKCKLRVKRLEELIAEDREADKVGKFSPTRREKIERLSLDIQKMTLPSEQYSAVARACLLQDDRQWVRNCVA